jgi:chromosome partitioning protein
VKNIQMKAKLAQSLLPPDGFDEFLSEEKNRLYEPKDLRAIRIRQQGGSDAQNFNRMPVQIPVRMSKGGVGKTTVVGNLGSALAMMGYRVLLVDGDPQASLTGLMGIDWAAEELTHIGELMRRCYRGQPVNIEEAVKPIYADGHLDLIAADITLAEADSWMMSAANREFIYNRMVRDCMAFFSRYEVVLIDTAPSTSLLTNALMLASNEILAVVMLDGQSLKAMQVLASNVNELNNAFPDLNLGVHIVANGYHPSYGSCKEALQTLGSCYPNHLNDNILPFSASFRRQINMLDDALSGTVLEREPGTVSAEAVINLAWSLIDRYQIHLDGQWSPVADLRLGEAA